MSGESVIAAPQSVRDDRRVSPIAKKRA